MTSPLRPEDPTRVGEYELTGRIGKGGQGIVYLGRDPGGNRVAVKVMTGSWAADTRLRNRFAKEVEAASKVAAFCTAAVLDSAPDADPPYIVSEYIEGPSLRQAVLEEGPRSGTALDRLAIATATALVAIHQAGVVHRDFKPANVLLGPDGPRVIDFGIARSSDATITSTRSIVGTPAYMAPEQVRGREVTFAVDVFAWAGVMAFAASGVSPFQDDTLPAVINRVLNEQPLLDEVDDRLRPLIEACLDKNPDNRPSAVQVLGMLVGHDPATVPGVPVASVLADGYTAAVSEQTKIAATVALPIPTAQTAATRRYGDGGSGGGAVGGLAGLTGPAATRVSDGEQGSGPATGPTTGPTTTSGALRTTSGLASLVGGGAAGAAGGAAGPAGGAGAVPAQGGAPEADASPVAGGRVPAPTVSPESDPVSPGSPVQPGGHGDHGGHGGGPVHPVGPRPPVPGAQRGLRHALSWMLAVGLLVIVGAGGWFLFGGGPPSDGPEIAPVDDAVVDSPEPSAEQSPLTEPSPVESWETEEEYTPPPVDESYEPSPSWDPPTWGDPSPTGDGGWDGGTDTGEGGGDTGGDGGGDGGGDSGGTDQTDQTDRTDEGGAGAGGGGAPAGE
ncbi:serine/threonine-protein kinase [Actinorugispora endophytica]|uniref:Serine/threonine protein kinase n=1 Tax=Actinorugispora endophytica TaxID=1605990 RepID=A0A4R6V850_9ACTN|nr:serine/threonine-protein kinase [Actinorugispora endophytica]TDQ55299.1 serine/threonine protein kinase [Actinorugispora endophytica]